jgi:hypothetical protein
MKRYSRRKKMEIIVNIIIMVILGISLVLNWALILRIADHDAEFYMDKTDPENVKPVIKFDLDNIEEKNFFIVKVLKDKDSGDNKRG